MNAGIAVRVRPAPQRHVHGEHSVPPALKPPSPAKVFHETARRLAGVDCIRYCRNRFQLLTGIALRVFPGVVNVVIGYQSKTINTVTAGTLLRAQGYLEHRLADITTRTGTKYAVR